jgi:hypothetical protein
MGREHPAEEAPPEAPEEPRRVRDPPRGGKPKLQRLYEKYGINGTSDSGDREGGHSSEPSEMVTEEGGATL